MLHLRPLISASGRCQPGRFLFPAFFLHIRQPGASVARTPPACAGCTPPPEGIRNDLASLRIEFFRFATAVQTPRRPERLRGRQTLSILPRAKCAPLAHLRAPRSHHAHLSERDSAAYALLGRRRLQL